LLALVICTNLNTGLMVLAGGRGQAPLAELAFYYDPISKGEVEGMRRGVMKGRGKKWRVWERWCGHPLLN